MEQHGTKLVLPKKTESKAAEAEAKPIRYDSVRLPHFFLTSGAKVSPGIDGLYEAKSQAESDQLAYYASKGLIKEV